MPGLELYDAPAFDSPLGPRTGPGGYPLGGYARDVGGYGSFGYSPITGSAAPQGLPAGLQGRNGYAGAAATIIGGSRAAEESLQQGYRALFAKRALGVVGARQESQRRLVSDRRPMGLSGGLSRRIGLEQDTDSIRHLGEAGADADFGFFQSRAELQKGTATELAGLKERELGTSLSAYIARKARKQAATQGWIDFAGNVIGSAARAASGSGGAGGGGT